MPMKKPVFFAKVMQTLSQLSTAKGFSIKQIAEHLQQTGVNRDLIQIKSIVEQSLQYGIRNKMLQEKRGRYNLTPTRLRCLQVKPLKKEKKKKRVRFRKCSNENIKKSKKQSTESKLQDIPTEEQTASQLRIEKKEIKEPLDVTPERDVHDNCMNKNKDRTKETNIRQPPDLEPEEEIGFEPPRPPNKIIRNTPSRSRLKQKYKQSSSSVEQGKHLNLTDDKNYRKHKIRSRHYSFDHVQHSNSEDSSDCDRRSKCNRHNCCRRHSHPHHRSYNNLNHFSLKRKDSNNILEHLNKSKHVLESIQEDLTPFEMFLESNHLETIPEITSINDSAEEVEDEARRHKYHPSYIN